MILCIADVLTSEELDLILSKLKTAPFVDGKATAGWHARLVKQNTQLASKALVAEEVKSIVHKALERNTLFQMAVRPKYIRPVLFSRYEPGMFYGNHVDNALMESSAPIDSHPTDTPHSPAQSLMRSDVSLTLFLNAPSTYIGGELVIESIQGEQAFKLDAGAVVIYPSSTLHRVEPVTQGVRLVAITWIQSLIRDPNEREILFDLDTVRQALFKQSGKTPEFDLIAKSHANLLRKWAEF
ncbi:MAG: Fe2+-dependent dioxygenase [Cyanobacteria bacterium CRU_2_1]|nr:Fe2+-dependent dioxygenase [Cyanobacteria bacterium CRU_2_1]